MRGRWPHACRRRRSRPFLIKNGAIPMHGNGHPMPRQSDPIRLANEFPTMSFSTPTQSYEIARHSARLPEARRDRFAFFALRGDFGQVMDAIRNAPRTADRARQPTLGQRLRSL